MKVTEVTFKRNYAISPLTMEHMHLQVTVAVEENESGGDALKFAQKQVEDYYVEACRQSSPSEYEPKNSQTNFNNDKIYVKMLNDLPIQVSLMAELEACDNLEVLKSYRFAYKTFQEQDYYDKKIEFLTKK